jgi:hypothetical protein
MKNKAISFGMPSKLSVDYSSTVILGGERVQNSHLLETIQRLSLFIVRASRAQDTKMKSETINIVQTVFD